MRLCDRACRQTYLSNGKPGLGDRTEEQVSCMRMVHGLWFSRARVACDITNKRRFMGQSVQVQMENNALCLSYMFELATLHVHVAGLSLLQYRSPASQGQATVGGVRRRTSDVSGQVEEWPATSGRQFRTQYRDLSSAVRRASA